MAKFTFRGKPMEDVEKMETKEFAELLTSRKRRSLKKGFGYEQKKLLKKIKEGKGFLKTHRRDMIILPQMIGKKIGIHNGKEFVAVEIRPEMVGHCLGEFAMTRKETKHSSPGMGATRGSKFVPLK
jgi:small subunit ribosomal protein S19